MSLSHLLTLLVAVCLSVSGCDRGGGPDNPDTRRLAALRYQQAFPMEQMMDELTTQIAMQAPAAARDEIKKMMFEGIDFKRVREASIEVMIAHFTASEINALTDFYSSAEGRAVMKKMPTYTAQLMPLIQQEVMRNMPNSQP